MHTTRGLPTELDFDPYGGCLGCQHAWRNFGGLIIEQAQTRFLENPLYYQEDFMFMGGNAFAYYFPVIENYLYSVPDCVHDHDHEAWILSHAIQLHFTGSDLPRVRHLAGRVLALAGFVQANIDRFGYYEEVRNHVSEGWSELTQAVNEALKSDSQH